MDESNGISNLRTMPQPVVSRKNLFLIVGVVVLGLIILTIAGVLVFRLFVPSEAPPSGAIVEPVAPTSDAQLTEVSGYNISAVDETAGGLGIPQTGTGGLVVAPSVDTPSAEPANYSSPIVDESTVVIYNSVVSEVAETGDAELTQVSGY